MKHVKTWNVFNESVSDDFNRDKVIEYFVNILFTRETSREIPYELLSKFEKYFNYKKIDFEKLSNDELNKIWNDWDDATKE